MAKKKRNKQRSRKQKTTRPAPSNKNNIIQQGADAFRRGEYPRAVRFWKQALQMEPNETLPEMLAEAYFRQAVSMYDTGGIHQVISELHQCIQYNPKSPIYLYHLGLAYHRNDNLEKAISWYQRAIAAEPTNSRFQYHLALAYMESEQFSKCMEILKDIHDARGKYGMAVNLLQQEQPEAVLELFQNDNDGYGLFFKGLSCLMAGDNKGAKAELRNAVKLVEDGAAGIVQYYLGVAYAISGNLFSAVKTWEAILNDDQHPVEELSTIKRLVKPDLMNIYRELAAEYVHVGSRNGKDALDKSIKIWGKMLKLQPDNTAARNNLVRAYFLEGNQFAKEGNLKKAITRWERVAELDAKNADVLHNLALAYDKLEDAGMANRYWSQVVNCWKKDLRTVARDKSLKADTETIKKRLNLAHKHLANNYLKLQRVDKAISEYRNATSCIPDDTDSLVEMGKLHLTQNRFSNAAREFQKAHKYKPNDVDILNYLAFAYAMNDKYEQAVECWETALTIEPDNELVKEQFTACCREQAEECWHAHRYERAIKWLERGVQSNPQDYSLHAFMGGIHLENGDVDAATTAFAQAIDINPSDPRAYAGVGHYYLQEYLIEEAEQYFSQAMEMDSDNPITPITIGGSYCGMDDMKSAEKYFNAAISRNPKDTQVYLSIGVALLENEEPRPAQKYLKKGVKAIPDAPEIHMLLAQAYILDEQIRKAQKELDIALRLAREQNNDMLVELIEQMQVTIHFSSLFGGLFDDEEDIGEFFMDDGFFMDMDDEEEIW